MNLYLFHNCIHRYCNLYYLNVIGSEHRGIRHVYRARGWGLDLNWQPGGAGIRQIDFLWQKLNKGEHPPKSLHLKKKGTFVLN